MQEYKDTFKLTHRKYCTSVTECEHARDITTNTNTHVHDQQIQEVYIITDEQRNG